MSLICHSPFAEDDALGQLDQCAPGELLCLAPSVDGPGISVSAYESGDGHRCGGAFGRESSQVQSLVLR
jgi:hypothetical protein